VAIDATENETIRLVLAASHTSGSFQIVFYHLREKLPNGMVANRFVLKEKMTLTKIGIKIKAKTNAK